jgi:septum formation inhibitor-activating ATPase MinD
MKALTHADSAITCVISTPVITSAPSAKRFLAELQSARARIVGVTLTSKLNEARRIAANIAKQPEMLKMAESYGRGLCCHEAA